LVDRQDPGREASWAGAGILPPAKRDPGTHSLEQLRGLSHGLHEEWARQLGEETGIDTGYRRCGGIYLARTAGEAAALHGLASELLAQGIQAEQLSTDALAALEPAITPTIRAACLVPDEAQLRNPRHVQALVAACRLRHVDIASGVEVIDCVARNGRIESLRTASGEERAGRVCFTAGAWTYGLLARLGVETGILPVRGQIVLFQCPAPPFHRILSEGPRYLVPRDDGRVLVGSTEEEAGFDKSTTKEAIRELTQLAIDLVPTLRHAQVERTWAGLRPGSFDGLPYIGPIPGSENGFVAAGHFRSGLHLSTGTAVVMGQLIRGLQPEIDLSPFQIARGDMQEGTTN
jgi:glycine oxidase